MGTSFKNFVILRGAKDPARGGTRSNPQNDTGALGRKRERVALFSRPQKKWMRLAIRSAQAGIRRPEGGPFGAVIVQGSRGVAVAHNTVLLDQDATCHAEIKAIRLASRKLKRFDLSDCVIYSTTEPCPMCFSAIHWARIAKVIFGTSIADVQKRGFHELSIPSRKMKREGKSPVSLQAGFMKKECRALLSDWDRRGSQEVY